MAIDDIDSPKPDMIIRFGSHAEKEYVLKLARFLDGFIVGANLFQATPGATASLLVKVGGKDTRFYIDPMTYAYGTYVDPKEPQLIRNDLDWIKSDQIRKDSDGQRRIERDFKRSYRSLGELIGWPLSEALKNNQAITPSTFTDEARQVGFCKSVAEYQTNRIESIFKDDSELGNFIDNLPRPAAVYAPYFYIEPTQTDEWLALNLQLMEQTSHLGLDIPVHGIICAHVDHLLDTSFKDKLLDLLPSNGLAGIWLWFSGFFEESAPIEILKAYRTLVRDLSSHMEVYALHGGFFSLSLSKYGMKGISHGVGYGEQKDVVPVIGQSTPTVRYYFPPLAKRMGVPDIEIALEALNVKTPEEFYKRVCGCAVCRGVISSSVDEFSSFGDMHYSRPEAKRAAQTPAAAKRCRFHFLLCRIRERDEIANLSIEEIIARLNESNQTWGSQYSLISNSGHLRRWAEALIP